MNRPRVAPWVTELDIQVSGAAVVHGLPQPGGLGQVCGERTGSPPGPLWAPLTKVTDVTSGTHSWTTRGPEGDSMNYQITAYNSTGGVIWSVRRSTWRGVANAVATARTAHDWSGTRIEGAHRVPAWVSRNCDWHHGPVAWEEHQDYMQARNWQVSNEEAEEAQNRTRG